MRMERASRKMVEMLGCLSGSIGSVLGASCMLLGLEQMHTERCSSVAKQCYLTDNSKVDGYHSERVRVAGEIRRVKET